MVLTKKPFSKKPRRKMGGRRLAVRRPLKFNANAVGGPNTARVSETVLNVPILANTGFQVEINGIMGARAQSIAPNFGLYRIARVVYKFKPSYDTYASTLAGGNGPATVPHLYWKMNRFADAPPALTATNLRDLGAKAIRFDDKTVTVAYKPNVLVGNASGGSNSGSIKMTPWLNTDSAPDTGAFALSTTNHYGHFHLVECSMSGAGTAPVGYVDVTIYYEFKNPLTRWASSTEAPAVRHLTDMTPADFVHTG